MAGWQTTTFGHGLSCVVLCCLVMNLVTCALLQGSSSYLTPSDYVDIMDSNHIDE